MKNIIYIMADTKDLKKKGSNIIPVCRIQMNDDGSAHISFQGFSVHMVSPTFDTIIKCITYNNISVDKFGNFLYSDDSIKISVENKSPKKPIIDVLDIFELLHEFNKTNDLTANELITSNLRFAYTRLSDYILGTDYYNMGCDVYSCDKMVSFDIIGKFDRLKHANLVLTSAVIALSVSTILALILPFFTS